MQDLLHPSLLMITQCRVGRTLWCQPGRVCGAKLVEICSAELVRMCSAELIRLCNAQLIGLDVNKSWALWVVGVFPELPLLCEGSVFVKESPLVIGA
ncbi:hypothetical protein F511_13817 [Dorcoceras hygrometricum]|uniref:Uncharacterized protein n=1 Tax=Dorcoceras hygrometricum TaxID=472368 RepID=A0A2Z7DAU3_9LAMI|nr:hypothetical protein F511_13817 [Dorcoceras hygrometricum]